MRSPRESLAIALSGLCVALLAACAGAPVLPPPPDLPALGASWAPLTAQIPASASAVYLTELDDTARREFDESLSLLDVGGGLSVRLEDALGLEFDDGGAFDALGLRLGGGASAFILRDSVIAVADLSDPERARQAVVRAQQRNPDLPSRTRATDVGEVITFELFDEAADAVVPRVHLLVTSAQLVALWDRSSMPDESLVDELLEQVVGGEWRENLLYNARFGEALEAFGGDGWALAFADTAAVLDTFTQRTYLREAANESQLRCVEVDETIRAAVPDVALSVSRAPLPEPIGATERIETARLTLGPGFETSARQWLLPSRIDPEQLAEGAMAAGVLNLDLGVGATLLSGFSDASGCPGPAGWLGTVGEYALTALTEPTVRTSLDGLIAGALFEGRTSGGLPFVDVALVVGSPQPEALSALFERSLEEGLGVLGTAETMAGLQAVRYRVGLIYQLTLMRGESALGALLGRVPERWIEQVFGGQSEAGRPFLYLEANGRELSAALADMTDILVGQLDDPELEAVQRELFEQAISDLRRVVSQTVRADLTDRGIEIRTQTVVAGE